MKITPRGTLVNRQMFTTASQIPDVEETQAREAARLRAATGRAGTISAVDALVAALASGLPDAVVLTRDPLDLRALAEHTAMALRVVST